MSVILMASAITAQAQSSRVGGRVLDTSNQNPLTGANVLLNRPDGTEAGFTTSDAGGRFEFGNIPFGTYLLHISYLGYQERTDTLRIQSAVTELQDIGLAEDARLLGEVEIKEKTPPAVQKGDTTEFNAAAFKTQPDANVEDLVQKMPGIQMQDGRVQAQGENVQRVLVDGKPFFGDDATAALRNLPAEIVDKIQVFDQLSEQAQFSGFDDGNQVKTINIVTRANRRNGQFGKVYGGYGDQGRYQAGLVINRFDQQQRITLLAQSNNLNQQNFATEDLVGALGSSGGGGARGGWGGPGGGGGRGGRGGGNVGDFLVDQRNGISKTHSAGLNFSDQWGKQVTFNASYFYNRANNESIRSIFRDYVGSAQEGQTYAEDARAQSVNQNHRVNAQLEWKIDSMKSLFVRPRLSIQENDGNSATDGLTQILLDPLSSSSNFLNTALTGYNFSNELLYRHRFEKRGRTLSIQVNNGLSNNRGSRNLTAVNRYFENGGEISDSLDQLSRLDGPGWSTGGNITYTEPFDTTQQISFTYAANIQVSRSDQETFSWTPASEDYTQLDTLLSSVFRNRYQTQQAGVGYRFNRGSWMWMVRANYQYAFLDNNQTFPFADSINRSFHNVLPFAMARYQFSRSEQLRFFYRSSTNAPSASQLQEVVNNSNPLQLSTGNSGLAQEVRHNLSLRYNKANPTKNTSLFAFAGVDLTSDYLGNETYIVARDTQVAGIPLLQGAQLTRPVNLDGYMRLRSFVNYGMPLAFIKSNFNLNLSANYGRTPGRINGAANESRNQQYGIGGVISSNINERVDFTLSSNTSMNYVRNSLQAALNSDYVQQTSRAAVTWYFLKQTLIQTELTHQYFSGLSDAFNQNYLLWNVAIAQKLFKGRGELRLAVFDLLRQNNSIQRTVTDVYVEDQLSNVLQRYFLLSFTYQLRHFGQAPATPREENPQDRPWMPPPGGRHGF